MTQLILKGADIDIICEETKNTMLHYSVKMGSVLVTHMLIERGARIKTQNVYSETTLHIAAGLNNNIDILHNLILHDGKESINHPDEVSIIFSWFNIYLLFCYFSFNQFVVEKRTDFILHCLNFTMLVTA